MMGIFFYRDWIVLFLSRSDRFSFVFSYSFSSYYHLENDGTRDCIQGDWRRKRADEHKTRAPAKPRFGRRFNCALLVYLSCCFGPNRTRDFKRVLSNQFALGGRGPASKPLIRVTSARVHVKELPFSCFLYIFFNWSCVIFQGRRLSHSRNRHLFGSLNLRISSMPDRESVTSIRRKTNNERQADGKCEITTKSAVVIRQSG